MNALDQLLDWRVALDVVVLTAIVFLVYHSLRSMGTWKIALGVFVAAMFFSLASLLKLTGVTWLFAQFSPVAVLALIVIFQPELRRVLERVISLRLARRGRRSDLPELIADLLFDLSTRRWGAILVFTGRDPLEQWLSEGKRLDGIPSAALLLSLFDPSSPGHDGAALLEAGRVSRFGVKLPLSTSGRLGADLGTRHHAAMGLAERSDALALVVSEERGTVTSFRSGERVQLDDRDAAARCVRSHLEGAVVRQGGEDERRQRRRALALELAVSVLLVVLFKAVTVLRGG